MMHQPAASGPSVKNGGKNEAEEEYSSALSDSRVWSEL